MKKKLYGVDEDLEVFSIFENDLLDFDKNPSLTFDAREILKNNKIKKRYKDE